MSSPTESKSEQVETPSSEQSPVSVVDGVEDDRIEIDEEALEEPNESEQLATLQEELASTKDRWLRAVADLENYKKRSKRENDEAVQRGVQKLLNDFLPVVDNLNRAQDAAQNVENSIGEGIAMVKQVFLSALDKNGIVAVPGVGAPFDPAHHDAMQQVPSEEYPPGHVVMVFESGFSRHGRLLRPAKVIVSDESSTGTLPEQPTEGE